MWLLENEATGITNKATVPVDGVISVIKPDSATVLAWVNDAISGVHHIHVKAGDTVQFKIAGSSDSPIELAYNGEVSYIKPPILKVKDGYHAVEEKDENMSPTEAVNLFAMPNSAMGGAGAGGMAGLGAGLIGGALGGVLFGDRDHHNGYDHHTSHWDVDPFQNQANMSIMEAIGDVKASIPLAEGQVQLAICNAQADINKSVQSSTGAIIGATSAIQTNLMNNLNMQTQMNQKGFADNSATTVAVGNANMIATKDLAAQTERNTWQITQAICTDGDKTRELIRSIDKTNDSRTITNLANEVTELRHEGRLREATGNLTISNTNTATAVAQQQQAQQQQQQLSTLLAHVHTLYDQNQRIQQGVLNIGSGSVSGTNQNAANTRVS